MRSPRFSRFSHEVTYRQIDRFRPFRGYFVEGRFPGSVFQLEVYPVVKCCTRLPGKRAELEKLALLVPGERSAALDKLVQVKSLITDYAVRVTHPLPVHLTHRELKEVGAAVQLAIWVTRWLRRRFCNYNLEDLPNSGHDHILYHCSFCGVVCVTGKRLCDTCAGELLY